MSVISGTWKTNMSWRSRSRMGGRKPPAVRTYIRAERCQNFPGTNGSTEICCKLQLQSCSYLVVT